MLHLLPQEYIKEIKSEYNTRVSVLSLWLLATTFVLGIVSLAPSFFMLNTENGVIEDRSNLANSSIDSEEKTKLLNFEAGLKEKLEYLDQSNTKQLDVLEHIFTLMNDGISLRSIHVGDIEGVTEIMVAGVSATRSDLSNFQKKLKESDIVKSVDIPLSVFTKEKDLDFSMVIKVGSK